MCAENRQRGRMRADGGRSLTGEVAGAPPRAPFRELFEKSSLKTLKNFSERRSKLFCAQRVQDGLRGEGGRARGCVRE